MLGIVVGGKKFRFVGALIGHLEGFVSDALLEFIRHRIRCRVFM